MSHKCGKNCRRKRGLGHCESCLASRHAYRGSSNGAGGPRPVTGGKPSIALQIIRANRMDQ